MADAATAVSAVAASKLLIADFIEFSSSLDGPSCCQDLLCPFSTGNSIGVAGHRQHRGSPARPLERLGCDRKHDHEADDDGLKERRNR
ncbi:MAG: hypothetical protein JKP98_17750 [Rhodobacteraceae bacterium]|nr:hypothetical protein [Paracoccaceae bacterium]